MPHLYKILNNKPAAVFGLARSGLAAVRALRGAGVEVCAWDDNEGARAEVAKLGATITELNAEVLKNCACLILSPGVPLYFPAPHPVVMAARTAGVEIISDIELFHRMNPAAKTIGITGTNGKSTTTALITHILQGAGINAVMGGNIGVPVFDLAPSDIYVLEMSSYQIDLCPTFRPDIAVLLNITPDHLDRHGTMENYAASKERIFGTLSLNPSPLREREAEQREAGRGVAIISVDDEYSRAIFERTMAKAERTIIPVSVHAPSPQPSPQWGEGVLRGMHNYQNILMAHAVCRELNIGEDDFANGLGSFPGLPHRQFEVRRIGEVAYINDSKATNAEATSKALSAYDDIYWIVGGRPKDGGLKGLEPFTPRIRKAFLIGESENDFAAWMKENIVPYERCGTMDRAIIAAHMSAQKTGTGTVLLSPACASFDQFKSYEERGDVFAFKVNKL
jgi:UDP-N-acetylmuramoylalanine--D-glutamate ligase